ncbi:MAG: hypothetical protein AAF389_16105 [Gemmatimonadota bacterium]
MILDAEDREIIAETHDELLERPPPVSRGPAGCVTGIAGLALLGAWPAVRGAVPGGDFLSPFVILIGVALVLLGPVAALLGRGGRRTARAAIEAALVRLEDPESDREVCLRAATVLVCHAHLPGSSTPELVLDRSAALTRLGGRVDLVRAVEDHLEEVFQVPPALRETTLEP